jgi:hypothetical protein
MMLALKRLPLIDGRHFTYAPVRSPFGRQHWLAATENVCNRFAISATLPESGHNLNLYIYNGIGAQCPTLISPVSVIFVGAFFK